MDHADVDRGSPLLVAARPVLDALDAHLHGTAFCTLLVDREGRVARRGCGDAGARRAIDALGVDVGASLLEDRIGTNAPGTVLETRTRITVDAHEHFALPLRRFSCYGHPIFHPMTRRLEGVLDITAVASQASPLLPPLVARAVADIEQRLLDGSRVSEKELLAAFQSAAGRRRAVLAVGEDLVMSNQAALDLLASTDVALLRRLSPELAVTTTRVGLTLASGIEVSVHADRVAGGRGGTLLHIDPVARPRERRTPAARPSPATAHAPVLVWGAPGTGRTTRARELAGDEPLTVLGAAAALVDGPQAWIRDFVTHARAGQGVVCVDGLDLLTPELLEVVADHVSSGRPPRTILVSGPLDALSGRAAALAALCTEREELVPLAARLVELPEIAATMLRELDPEGGLHLGASAVRALSAQEWPGNLRELRAVLEHAVRRRTSGALCRADLPEHYRATEPAHRLAPLARAERAAIVAALRECAGNKVRAAEQLGISRTTLYAKLRTLRITGY